MKTTYAMIAEMFLEPTGLLLRQNKGGEGGMTVNRITYLRQGNYVDFKVKCVSASKDTSQCFPLGLLWCYDLYLSN